MKKTFYTLFLLLVLLLNLPCANALAEGQNVFETNAFRIVRKSYDDGHISLSYIFPMNSKMLKKEGFSDEEVQVFRFYLTTYVNALAKSNAEKAGDGVSVENSKYFIDVDGVGFSIAFENLDAQKRFFGISDDEENPKNNQHKSGFFMKKTIIKTTFPVSSKKSAGDLKMICLMAASSWATNNPMSQEKKSAVMKNYDNSIFIYDFATQTRGLKSDVMYEDENFCHNVFLKTLDEIESDASICFWVTSVNTPIWYIGAIVVVVASMISAAVVIKVRQKKKKLHKK